MDAKTFFSKVCAMRKAQKAYFKTRDVQVLRQSKALEKEIDDEIARVAAMNLQEPPRQPKQREFHWER